MYLSLSNITRSSYTTKTVDHRDLDHWWTAYIWDLNEHDQREFRSMQDNVIRQRKVVLELMAVEIQQALAQYRDAFALLNRSLDISNGVSGRHFQVDRLVHDISCEARHDLDAYRLRGINCCVNSGQAAIIKCHRRGKWEAD